MEKFARNWCLAAACIIAGLGCSKNENNILETSAVNQASTNYKYTVPAVPGYTPPKGVEPGPPIPFPIRPDTLTAGSPLYGYGGPNPDYLKNTCLFTISHLEEGSTYHQINNEKLNIAFYSADGERRPISVRRLKPTTPYPYGWTEHWNSPPFVENEHPEVLFTSDFETTFIIVFSKRCVKFGMELSPNIQNVPCWFNGTWGNFLGDNTYPGLDFQLQTPSGAAVFAEETAKGFKEVTVRVELSPFFNINPEGVAIATIRYELAK